MVTKTIPFRVASLVAALLVFVTISGSRSLGFKSGPPSPVIKVATVDLGGTVTLCNVPDCTPLKLTQIAVTLVAPVGVAETSVPFATSHDEPSYDFTRPPPAY